MMGFQSHASEVWLDAAQSQANMLWNASLPLVFCFCLHMQLHRLLPPQVMAAHVSEVLLYC